MVAHGSRAAGPQRVVEDLLAMLVGQRPGLRACAAYVDNASPSIRAALQALAGDGVPDLAVVPLLLTPASHSKTDIAASVQAGRLAHPRMRLRYGRPLGPHPVLVEVLARRLAEVGAGDEDPVLLVAGGTLDPDANAQVAAIARLLAEGRPWPSVDIAFAGTAKPSVRQGLERLRREGHTRVSIARYFLGGGFLANLVARQAADVQGIEVLVADPVGVSEELAGLLLERLDEAVGGDVRMNCDACLHRIPFPGHTRQLHAPQDPHPHPDDPLP